MVLKLLIFSEKVFLKDLLHKRDHKKLRLVTSLDKGALRLMKVLWYCDHLDLFDYYNVIASMLLLVALILVMVYMTKNHMTYMYVFYLRGLWTELVQGHIIRLQLVNLMAFNGLIPLRFWTVTVMPLDPTSQLCIQYYKRISNDLIRGRL